MVINRTSSPVGVIASTVLAMVRIPARVKTYSCHVPFIWRHVPSSLLVTVPGSAVIGSASKICYNSLTTSFWSVTWFSLNVVWSYIISLLLFLVFMTNSLIS